MIDYLDQNYNEINYNEIGTTINLNPFKVDFSYLQEGKHIGDQEYFKTKIGAEIKPLIKISGLKSKSQIRCINGDVLSGSITTNDGFIGFYNYKNSN